MKKIIGVMPLWDDKLDSLWMLSGYMDAIQEADGLPFIFPFTNDTQEIEQLCHLCDGFLLTGGQDVNPSLYKEDPSDKLGVLCQKRDDLEVKVFNFAIKHDKAVLGICRGLQVINTALGGTLYQDLPTEYNSSIVHRMVAPYDRVWHYVDIENTSPLYQVLKVNHLGVNSCHHQAIKKLAPTLSPLAISEDGLVEAVYKKDNRFIWAVQWHPEFSHTVDENSRKIFKEFIKNC